MENTRCSIINYCCCVEEHTFLHRPANSPHSTRRYKKTHGHINTGNSGTVVVVEAEVVETRGMVWGCGWSMKGWDWEYTAGVINTMEAVVRWEWGREEDDVSPGTSVSASSGCPGRLWPYGPQSPYGWGPTPPGWAPVGPTPSSAAPLCDGAPGSPRLASAWPASCCCPAPLGQKKMERDNESGWEGGGGGGRGGKSMKRCFNSGCEWLLKHNKTNYF